MLCLGNLICQSINTFCAGYEVLSIHSGTNIQLLWSAWRGLERLFYQNNTRPYYLRALTLQAITPCKKSAVRPHETNSDTRMYTQPYQRLHKRPAHVSENCTPVVEYSSPAQWSSPMVTFRFLNFIVFYLF